MRPFLNQFTAKTLVRNSKKSEKNEKAQKKKLKKAIEKGNMDGARIYAQVGFTLFTMFLFPFH